MSLRQPVGRCCRAVVLCSFVKFFCGALVWGSFVGLFCGALLWGSFVGLETHTIELVQCAAVCCSVLQCVVVCCSVMQFGAS